jgi:Tfp pilus assembly protein FimT
MVLLVMAIGATLAAPAFARLGTEQPSRGADQLLTMLQAARRAAFEHNATVTLRLDPKSLAFQADTSSVAGAGILAQGVLQLGLSEALVTDQPRLVFVFLPSGAAYADSVMVRGGETPLIVRVDPWTGVARGDTR